MSTESLYNASKIFAAVLAVVSACIATASVLPDLGLTKQTVSILAVVQAGIAVTLTFLPAVQHKAGDVRGDG